jgi:GINS complex subunit 3
MSGIWDPGYNPNYFSLEDILVTQERVPVTVQGDLQKLGFLDPSSEDEVLRGNTKLEVPLWVVDGMNAGRKTYMSAQVPKTLKETQREILLADPNIVNLHRIGPHYFEFGRHVMKHCPQEGEIIGESIKNAFKSRFLNIVDAAQNCRDEETLTEMSKMDDLERSLFKKGYGKRKEMDCWKRREVYKIKTASMVINHKKRKALAME